LTPGAADSEGFCHGATLLKNQKFAAPSRISLSLMMNPSPSPELHARLRQATRQAHHVLDHHPLLAPLVRPGLTRLQYGHALAALHAVHEQVEAGILAFLARRPGLFDFESRRKLAALESDLTALGRAPLPAGTAFPVPDSLGALIGVLYVIEGSTLGGQVIARTLHQSSDGNLPVAFFTYYGDQVLPRWQAFLAFAESCPAEEIEAAASSAVALFQAIAAHLDVCLPLTTQE